MSILVNKIIDFSPPFMRPTLIRLHRLYVALYWGSRIICRAAYLRLSFIPYLSKTKRNHDSIMRYLDRWVLKHSDGGYVNEVLSPSGEEGIQQVRREISEFVRILLLKGLDNNILEIGLGYHGGTHMLWRQIFKQVVTIESDPRLIKKFKLNEWLDSRSIIIAGKSEDPATLKRVQRCLDSVDVLFIDSDHKYECVAQDWAMYHNLVRPGGIIAFHDSICKYPGYGVAKFLEDLSRGAIDNRCHILQNIVYSDNTGTSYEEL